MTIASARPLMGLSTLTLSLFALAACDQRDDIDDDLLDEPGLEDVDIPTEPGHAPDALAAPGEEQPELGQWTELNDGTLMIRGDEFRIRVHPARRVAELNVSTYQLQSWYASPLEQWAPEATDRLYQAFADDFDFIVFVPDSPDWHPEIKEDGASVLVRNEVEGIGLPIFDDSESFSSPGQLQSVIQVAGIDMIRKGPLLREIGSRWANGGYLPSAAPGRWGFADVGGVLGGCDPDEMFELQQSTWFCDHDGTQDWSPEGAELNDRLYARLELYLMGLVSADSLQPIRFVEDATWVSEADGVFAGEATTLTMPELIAKHGERSPAHTDSQKEFRTLFVMLSAGELAGDDTFHLLDARVAEFAAPYAVDNGELYNFYEAASFLASLDAEDLDMSIL